VWRLVTFILLPETLSPLWAALSIYLFYIIGTAVERNWGAFKFNMYYLIGMLGTLVGAVIVGLVSPSFAATTATYLNLSLFLAFATLFPNYQLMIFFVLPVKVKWLGWLQAAFLLWTILSSLFTLLGGRHRAAGLPGELPAVLWQGSVQRAASAGSLPEQPQALF
jgi:membrane associated rhomboid family serine protease